MLECNYSTSKWMRRQREEQIKGLCIMCPRCCTDSRVWISGRLWWDTVTVYAKKNYSNEIQRRIKVIITQLTMNKLLPWLKEFLSWCFQESLKQNPWKVIFHTGQWKIIHLFLKMLISLLVVALSLSLAGLFYFQRYPTCPPCLSSEVAFLWESSLE